MTEGHYILIRSRQAIIADLTDTWQQIEQAAHATGRTDFTFLDVHDIDPVLFARFIHGWMLLGHKVEPRLVELARPYIRPIGEVI